MANLDNPRGLVPFGEVKHVGHYKKDASAAAIFQGSPVIMEDDGYIAPYSSGGGDLLGVAAKYSPASTADGDIEVYDDPNQEFVTQDDASATSAQTNVGNCADCTAESGNTTTGISTCELHITGISGSTAQLKIKGLANTIYPTGVVNAWGAWADLIVQINEHLYRDTAGI